MPSSSPCILNNAQPSDAAAPAKSSIQQRCWHKPIGFGILKKPEEIAGGRSPQRVMAARSTANAPLFCFADSSSVRRIRDPARWHLQTRQGPPQAKANFEATSAKRFGEKDESIRAFGWHFGYVTSVTGSRTGGLQILTNIYSPNMEQGSAIKDFMLSRFPLKIAIYYLDSARLYCGNSNTNP